MTTLRLAYEKTKMSQAEEKDEDECPVPVRLPKKWTRMKDDVGRRRGREEEADILTMMEEEEAEKTMLEEKEADMLAMLETMWEEEEAEMLDLPRP